MEEPLLASSFLPPDVDAAAATSSPPRYPAWVLLDRKAYFADRENATTAIATSRTGHTVKVTFCLADPPAVSHCCVHGPEFNPEHFAEEPRVLSSEKDLVLLSFVFTEGPRHHVEYFIYKAGRGKPSLTPIPATPPGIINTLCVSIVPCDEGEFILADLFVTTTLGQYDLTFFSSKTGTWTTRRLELNPSFEIRAVDLLVVPHKVISLGRGVVGWVDLWRGIIGCNILQKDPVIYFIPLPKPEFNLPRIGDPRPVRDVACYNGVINLVEIDHHFRREVVAINKNSNKRLKMMKDLDSFDIIFDKDLLLYPHENYLGELSEEIISVPNGWKIRTCYRHTSSDNWHKGYCVHVDDFLANNPTNSTLLPKLLDGSVTKSTLRNLTTAYPTLNINGGDVVYVMSKMGYDEKNAWIVGVDLCRKTVKIVEPYFAERASYFKPDFLTCAFSEYLNTTQRSSPKESTSSIQDFVTPVYGDDNQQPHPILPQPFPLGLTPSASGSIQDFVTPVYGDDNQQPHPILPQPFPLGLTPSASEHTYPMNAQSMCPVLNTDAHGQLWLSMPLGGPFLSQLLQVSHLPFTPPMPQVPVPEVQLDNGPAKIILLPMPGKRAPLSVQHDSRSPGDTVVLVGTSAAPAVDPSPPA